MREMVIPLSWDSIDRLLAFLDDVLCGDGQLTDRRLQLTTLVEEVFSTAMASGGTGSFGCRVQPSDRRLVLRFDGGPIPADLTYLTFLSRQLTKGSVQVTPGVNSCLIQWS